MSERRDGRGTLAGGASAIAAVRARSGRVKDAEILVSVAKLLVFPVSC